MKRHVKLIFLVIGLAFFSTLSFCAKWHVFMYIDSSDDLNDMAIKTLTDILREKTDDSVSLRIQLHAYDEIGLRYQVTHDGLLFIEDVCLTGKSKQDFIDAAQWAFADNDAEYTMLIFNNHGWGILDPQWNDEKNEWEVGVDSLSNSCPIKKSLSHVSKIHKGNHKGFMFSVQPRIYLNNQDMVEGLCFIRDNLLHGKKIDILAFDTCMGGMLEVMYQVEPYVRYVVGNQVCALRDGFDYQNILKAIKQKRLLPRELAAEMVHIFDDYYKKHDERGIYAHTALDGAFVVQIAQALDNVVTLLLNMDEGAAIVRKAHAESPRFCLFPMYTDLVSFITLLEKLLLDNEASLEIKDAIQRLYALVPQFVVARCAGYTNIDKTHGCAIYLPSDAIDTSYRNTCFGQQTKWIDLLKCIEGQN